MNFIKRFLAKKRIKSGVKALKRVRALLLLALNFSARLWRLINSFCSLVKLVKRLS